MKTLAVIQARMGSTRLPGKVLMNIAGRPVLEWVVQAARAIPGVDEVVVAASVDPENAAIVKWCEGYGVPCYQGPENDVLGRMAIAVRDREPDTVIRITADCPLLDPQICGQVIELLLQTGAHYASNTVPRRWPDGTDCEAMRASVFLEADDEAVSDFDREHVTPFIRENRDRYQVQTLPCPVPGLGRRRWTLDTPEDYEYICQLTERLVSDRPPSFIEVLAAERKLGLFIVPEPHRDTDENEATGLGIGNNSDSRSYGRSDALLQQALKFIPLGTQTFSKAHTQFPQGVSPAFLSHGRDGRVWDVDGNRYVDMILGLLPVVLGYCDPDVDEAISRQLREGISFSLATRLEMELAERLTEIIPCAEMVRFGKNGTDATSAAVRLARAYTGRDHIATCGYHGWQDWYIGSTTRNKGVPAATQELTHRFPYNDPAALDLLLASRPREFAAVIMEPMTVEEPNEGYLETVRNIAHKHGALLVFDEIITGFRFALGGAQACFGVTPDLACFGKAMGNGMPISAVLGQKKIMAKMEDVFISGTFGGECLSLAASIAVIDKMIRESVIEDIWRKGEKLTADINALILRHDLGQTFSLLGKPCWSLINIKDHSSASTAAIKTMFKKEMLANGILIGASNNLCYAHDEVDMENVVAAYGQSLETIARHLNNGTLEAGLGCPVIRPVFEVRNSQNK
jgi:glutamate-1-semialdehyde aminotransferase/spore coat polysaccharide biosynthesis protein SpsF (cytidylyltransferase family)